ncbi:MAG: H-type lectin domain-containing protein [bacterium]
MTEIKRMNYFHGQWLREEDFEIEQKYHLSMRRRHNRHLHAWGVVYGLEVAKKSATEITVAPGMALDVTGREIVIDTEESPEIDTGSDQTLYVIAKVTEKETDKVDPESELFTRVTEKSEAEVINESDLARVLDEVVILARLQIKNGKIDRIDEGEPPYTRRMSGATGYGYFEKVGIGIGTATPNHKLEVSDNSSGQPAVFIDQNGDGWGLRVATSGSGHTPILRAEAPQNTVRLSVNANGNVGIGATEPDAKLEVKGSVTSTPSSNTHLRVSGDETDFKLDFGLSYDENLGNAWLQSYHLDGTKGGILLNPEGGNIGIGTEAPGSALELHSPDDRAIRLRRKPWTDGDHFGINTEGHPGNAFLSFSFNRVTNRSLVIHSRGNIGIGTANPENAEGWSRVLDILGSTTTKLSVRSNKIDGRILAHETGWWGTTGMMIGTKSNHPLSFATNNSFGMIIDTKGHVGIGTVTPGAILDIKADTRTTWASWFEAIRFSQDAHSAITHPGSGLFLGLHGGNDRRFYFGDARNKKYLMSLHADSGNLFAGTGEFSDSSQTLRLGTRGDSVLDVDFTANKRGLSIHGNNPDGSPLLIQAWSSLDEKNFSQRFYVGYNGDGYFSGNLCIGTNPSGHMLDIASTQGGTGHSAIRALFPGGKQLTGTEFGALAHRDGEWKAVYAKAGTGNASGKAIALHTEGEVNMMNGNVGIGTREPGRKLSIKTAAKGGVEGLDIKYGENGHSWGMGIMGPQNSNPNAFTVEHLNTDGRYHTKLLVDPDGKVGIGTTQPRTALHIHKDNNFPELLISGSGKSAPDGQGNRKDDWNFAVLNLWDSTNDRLWHITHRNEAWAGNQNKLIFWFGNNVVRGPAPPDAWESVLALDPVMDGDGNVVGGNVGIGTVKPGAKLDVNGTVSAGGYGDLAADINAFSMEIGGPDPTPTNGQATLFLHHHGKIAHQLRYNNGTLFFERAGNGYGTSNTPNLVVGGNVGIGTTSPPDAKLHVNGDLRLAYGQAVNSITTSLGTVTDNMIPTAKAAKSYVDWRVGRQNHIDIRSGVANADHSNNWTKKSRGVKEKKILINLGSGFSQKPDIVVSLAAVDAHRDKNLRIRVEASSVASTYFYLSFITWADTEIYSTNASWISYGTTATK